MDVPAALTNKEIEQEKENKLRNIGAQHVQYKSFLDEMLALTELRSKEGQIL